MGTEISNQEQLTEKYAWFPILIMCVALYFPVSKFEFFHVVALCVGLSLFLFNHTIRLTTETAIVFFLILSPLVAASFNIVIYETVSVRDVTEFIRFLPVLLIFFHGGKFQIENARILRWFLVYILIVLIVSIGQLFDLSFAHFFTDVYASEHHATRALSIDRRALGLSAGPGQNGAMAAIIYSFALAYFCIYKHFQKSALFTMTAAVLVVLLSQSQTAFIVIAGITVYATIYFLIQGNNQMKRRALSIFYVMLMMLGFLVYLLFDKIKYLLTLFTHGFSRNSYQVRLERTEEALSFISDSPFAVIYGLGKDVFGSLSSAMDNEFVFFLGVYGITILTLIILFYCLNFIFLWTFPAQTLQSQLILAHFLLVSGMVTSWATMFLTDPRMLLIVAILFSMLRFPKNSDNASENVKIMSQTLR